MDEFIKKIKNHWLTVVVSYTTFIVGITFAIINALIIDPIKDSIKNIHPNNQGIDVTGETAIKLNEAEAIINNELLITYRSYDQFTQAYTLEIAALNQEVKSYNTHIGERIVFQENNQIYFIDLLRERGNMLDIAYIKVETGER